MGTKTVDEAGTTEATEVKPDEETEDLTAAGEAEEADDEATDAEATDGAAGEDAQLAAEAEAGPSGVGQGAGAVVSAALGFVSLTGSWVGTVAAARETLKGQLETSSTASVAKQVKEIYGDAWHATAFWGGVFALLALIVGVVVLVRPAFGVPGRPQPVWIKSVAWGGVALGVLGLLLAVLKYTDVLFSLPSTS
ncbi:hypothetical protein ACYF6T_36085 [Streptomyces sp. 7R007]